jgi:phage gp46-like protein
MTDIRIHRSATLEAVTLDWLLQPTGLLDVSNDLATAVTVALGTDARAALDDVLPDPDDTARRGWWGDADAGNIWDGWDIGSKLWLMSRAKITSQNAQGGGTLFQIEGYIKEALQPFVDRRIATRFEVEVTRTGIERIDALVTMYRGSVPEVTLQFQGLWDQIRSA